MADKPSGLVDRSSFLASIRGDTAGGAWLLEGEEDNLKDEAIALIREKYLPEGLEELNEAALTAPDTDEIIAACETIPFMADKRLVIVRDLPGLAGQRETDDRLADYVPHVPDTCVLLLLLHGYANGAKKLPKAIGKKRRVDFCPMGDAEVSAWIIRRFEAEGKHCDSRTASRLAFTVGTDTAQLTGEVLKLCAYIGAREKVTEADVAAVATQSREYAAYTLTDAVVAGQEARAWELMHTLQRQGEDDVSLLAMISSQFRRTQMALIMRYEKRSPAEIAQATGMPPFAYDRLQRQIASRVPGVQARVVKESVAACLDLELAFKSGRITQNGLGETLLMRLFAIQKG